jgi:hypothetical protein
VAGLAGGRASGAGDHFVRKPRDELVDSFPVYLVAHDPETGARLAERRLVQPVPLKAAA